MTVRERLTTARLTAEELVTAIREILLGAGSRDTLESVLDAITDEATAYMHSRDVHAITLCRERLDRVARAVVALEQHDGAQYALGRLHTLSRQLARSRTLALTEADATQREQESEGIRFRVHALLSERPARPRDLARALDLDPSQVSRSLRELRDAGLVVARASPAAGDGRGQWYAAAAGAGIEAGA
jgi:DNA-binding transcriptional ArsR family regulator